MADDATDFEFRLIEPGDRLAGLSLGSDAFTPLKIFLQKNAKTYQEKSLARTYGAFQGLRIVGYVTLVCGEVGVSDNECDILDDDEIAYNYRHFPAIKIARLAVDKRFRGFQVGRTLVDISLGIAKSVVCPAVGCRFVIVDSKRESVVFYEKRGFTFLDTKANRERQEPVMFIDLHKINIGDDAAVVRTNSPA